jgi:hypothetical protein
MLNHQYLFSDIQNCLYTWRFYAATWHFWVSYSPGFITVTNCSASVVRRILLNFYVQTFSREDLFSIKLYIGYKKLIFFSSPDLYMAQSDWIHRVMRLLMVLDFLDRLCHLHVLLSFKHDDSFDKVSSSWSFLIDRFYSNSILFENKVYLVILRSDIIIHIFLL